jgi:hypothetical protein
MDDKCNDVVVRPTIVVVRRSALLKLFTTLRCQHTPPDQTPAVLLIYEALDRGGDVQITALDDGT